MAQLIEEVVVGNTAIKVKFLRTVRLSSITNERFSLATTAATPVVVANPFRPIEVSDDYDGIARTLMLYFNLQLSTVTTYKFDISGLVDASGVAIPSESIEFITGESTTPIASDPVDPSLSPMPVHIIDYSIGNTGEGVGTSGSLSSLVLSPEDAFYIMSSDPAVDEPIVATDYNNGRITVKFNKYPSLTFVNTTYFKAQKKQMLQGYSRWEPVAALVSADLSKPWVYVDFPSMDIAPVYQTAGKEYFPLDYKFRVRVGKDVDAAPGATTPASQGKLDLLIQQGATFRRTITYLQADGSSRDLTNYTARMQIKVSYEGTLLYELTTENGRIIIDGLNGRISMEIPALDTADFTWTQGVYDLEIVSPESTPTVTRLVEGSVKVTPEVTT